MTIELIEAFIKLIEHKSFVRAAESLYISQSSLSHRISMLEAELNTRLITRARGKRNFDLTQAGVEFIPLAERWMAISKDTANFKTGRRVPALCVASVETISFVLSSLYHKITFHPDPGKILCLEAHVYSSPQIMSEIENQNVDIGFAVRERAGKNLRLEPIFRERHYLVANLPYKDKMLNPAELDPHKEIITDWYPDYQIWHDACLGANTNPLATIDAASMVVNFMIPGAWCIVPESSVEFLKKNSLLNGFEVRTYDIPSPPPERVCYKVTHTTPRANRVDSIRCFEEQLHEFLRQLPFSLCTSR